MSVQEVHFVGSNMESISRVLHDRWAFSATGWYAPVSRLLFWCLIKMGALRNYVEETMNITHYRIDGDKFIDRIFKQRNELFKVHRQPRELLIGSEDYFNLMNETQRDNNHYFEFDTSYCQGSGHEQYKVVGLKIKVIPWMSGMLVMP